MFQMNRLPPSSELKSKPSKILEEAGGKLSKPLVENPA
jgi:hypothetical protein